MMNDLLKALMEGAQTQKPASQAPQNAPGFDILGEILQGAMGGGSAPQQPTQPQQQPSALNIADLIGMVLGGGQTGSSSQMGMNPLVAPIAKMLADKLGVSPQIAQMIVQFAMAALLSKRNERGTASGAASAQQGFDLDDLLEGDFAYSSGMASRLSQESGMSEDEAAYNLQEAMMMLSGHPAFKKAAQSNRPKAQPSPSKLDNLLDTWEVDG
jgi:hypothetical protein